MDFSKIAPYLHDPLVLIGFFLLLAAGFISTLVKGKIFTTISQRHTSTFLNKALLLGFILGVLIVILGFYLRFKQLNRVDPVKIPEIVKNVLTDTILANQQGKQTKESVKQVIQDPEQRATNRTDIKDVLKEEFKDVVREVDFGYITLSGVEINPIISSKKNKQMELYGGDDFEYHIEANAANLKLMVGDKTYEFPNKSGTLKIVGIINRPMKAYLLNPFKEEDGGAKFTVHAIPRGKE